MLRVEVLLVYAFSCSMALHWENRELNFTCALLSKETCILLAHCDVWSSRRCILMGVVASGSAAFLKGFHKAVYGSSYWKQKSQSLANSLN